MGRDLIGRPTVNLNFDIRLDTAENLIKHGPSLIRVLEVAIASAQHAIKTTEFDDLREIREQARRNRLAEVLRDGRRFHRLLRKRMRNLPDDLLRHGREFARRQTVQVLANELVVHPDYFQLAIKRHKKFIRPKLKERRERFILKCFFEGNDNAEISARTGIAAATVGGILGELRAEAASQKITLQDLHQNKTLQILVNRLITVGDEKIAKFNNLKKPRNPGEGNLPETISETSPGRVVDWEKIKSTKTGRPV